MEQSVWAAVRNVRQEIENILEASRGSNEDTRPHRIFERSEFPERSLGANYGTIGTNLTNLTKYKPI